MFTEKVVPLNLDSENTDINGGKCHISISHIIDQIDEKWLIIDIQNKINDNNSRVGLHSQSEDFIANENGILLQILDRISKEKDSFKKKEILFYAYVISEWKTRGNLVDEKTRIIDIIQTWL